MEDLKLKNPGTYFDDSYVSWDELIEENAFILNRWKTKIIGCDTSYIFGDTLVFPPKIKEICCPLILSGVKNLYLNNVTKISDNVFINITGIKNIFVDNKVFTDDKGILFNKKTKTLVRYPDESLNTIYDIPGWCTNIAPNAFNASSIEIIVIPSSFEKIQKFAFNNAVKLSKVYLPDTIKEIEEGAFKDCNIKEVDLPINLKLIGKDAFKNNSIIYITFPESLKEIKPGAFSQNRLRQVKLNDIKYDKTSFEKNIDIIFK